MYPELIEIPFIHLTVKSYGLMMVIGFLACVSLIRHLSRDFTPNPQHITNAALYSLVGGVVGARLFYIFHHFDNFRSNPIEVFAIWQGGLELLGGVAVFIIVILFYMWYHKLPMRRYLDVLAIGLMLALVFGRIGCFLNGCCYGKPTELPWAIRFPYYSYAYHSQINPDFNRNRSEPYFELPNEYYGYTDEKGNQYSGLKPYEYLTVKQQIEVNEGKYRCLPVHPTQLYSSAIAAFWCLTLFLFWRRSKAVWWLISISVGIMAYFIVRAIFGGGGSAFLFGFICGILSRWIINLAKIVAKPGYTFALMFIVYGTTRFLMEYLRDDNPFEFDGLTISQNIGIGMVLLGVILMAVFKKMKVRPLDI